MQAKHILALAALVATVGTASAQTVPAEQWVGSQASAVIAAGSLSRAEVVADLNLWRRAGLESAALADTVDSANPRYVQQLAAYTRARHSSVYTAEVQRVQGGANAVAGTASIGAQ